MKTYGVGNKGPGLEQAQKPGRLLLYILLLCCLLLNFKRYKFE